jgi:hypothetical protein
MGMTDDEEVAPLGLVASLECSGGRQVSATGPIEAAEAGKT